MQEVKIPVEVSVVALGVRGSNDCFGEEVAPSAVVALLRLPPTMLSRLILQVCGENSCGTTSNSLHIFNWSGVIQILHCTVTKSKEFLCFNGSNKFLGTNINATLTFSLAPWLFHFRRSPQYAGIQKKKYGQISMLATEIEKIEMILDHLFCRSQQLFPPGLH